MKNVHKVLFPKEWRKYHHSSGSVISNKLRLYITLRMLAGATYLDIILYEVSINHVQDIFVDMLEKIDSVLDNIKLPETYLEMSTVADGLSEKMIARHHFDPMSIVGNTRTLFAVDGIVNEILCPSVKDCLKMKKRSQGYNNNITSLIIEFISKEYIIFSYYITIYLITLYILRNNKYLVLIVYIIIYLFNNDLNLLLIWFLPFSTKSGSMISSCLLIKWPNLLNSSNSIVVIFYDLISIIYHHLHRNSPTDKLE